MHNQPNSPAISPLRQRLIDDMNLRHFGHETIQIRLRHVALQRKASVEELPG